MFTVISPFQESWPDTPDPLSVSGEGGRVRGRVGRFFFTDGGPERWRVQILR